VTPPSSGTGDVEPAVPLPAPATVATSSPDVEPLANVPTATALPTRSEPTANQQIAATPTPRDASEVQEVRERSLTRGPVASGHQVRNGARRVASPKLRGVKAASSRRHRVTRLNARGGRGIGATMDATRYRVGGALKCFLRFNCPPRRVAGTAIGAAAGAAVGRGGGAVAGALIGAVVLGR
jgi:hypothetical protein